MALRVLERPNRNSKKDTSRILGTDCGAQIGALRSAVRFEQSNLVGLNVSVSQKTLAVDDGFDVIFCRNVLMYFDNDAVKKVLKTIRSLLKDGGYLLLGHAESLLPVGSGFESVQIGRELIHRK